MWYLSYFSFLITAIPTSCFTFTKCHRRVDVKCKHFYVSHCCCSWSPWTRAGSWCWSVILLLVWKKLWLHFQKVGIFLELKLSTVMSSAGFLKHPRANPGGPGMDFQMAESEHLMKRMRAGQSDEVRLK